MRQLQPLIDIDRVLIPFPDPGGTTPAGHVHHHVVPAGRLSTKPVPVWLNLAHGPMLTALTRTSRLAPLWCTSWRHDASRLVAPLLGLPAWPHLNLPRPQIDRSKASAPAPMRVRGAGCCGAAVGRMVWGRNRVRTSAAGSGDEGPRPVAEAVEAVDKHSRPGASGSCVCWIRTSGGEPGRKREEGEPCTGTGRSARPFAGRVRTGAEGRCSAM